ncbi:uncharacterized protein [Montipora capricornis]|uniref:uncharacterized protein n=1 Tax=Montipora capricornis TaxID=246305 RepID=UPI0035F1C22F
MSLFSVNESLRKIKLVDSGESDTCCHLEDDKYDDGDEANNIDDDDNEDDESILSSDNFALLEMDATLTQLKRGIEECLNATDTTIDEIQGLQDVFAESDDLCKVTKTLTSKSLEKHWNEGVPCVEPVKKVLGKHRKVCKRNNKKILLSLQQQLSSPRLLVMIMTAEAQLHQRNNAIFTDFCDGTLFKEHPMFSSDEKALQLLLYYDDVNVCNPLTNKCHKLCLFYYQVANIVPIYQSKLRSIKLFAVCSYKTFKRCKERAMQEILEPLVSDLQLLGRDDGYTFTTSQGQVKLRGAVLAFLADTPASHTSAGFKEGVGSARRKCRHCIATFDSMQEYFEE